MLSLTSDASLRPGNAMHVHSILAACSFVPRGQALAATLLPSLWACRESPCLRVHMLPAAAPERDAKAAASPLPPEPQPAPTPAVETQVPPEEPAASSLDMPMPEWAPPGMSHAGDFPKVSSLQPPAGLSRPEWAFRLTCHMSPILPVSPDCASRAGAHCH